MKLVTLQPIEEEGIHAIDPDIEIVRADRNSLETAVRDAEVLVGNPGSHWPRILKTARKLKWVHVASAGVEHLLCAEFRDSKVVLTCGKGDVAGPVLAEHAFALILALSRGIGECVRVGKWIGRDSAVAEGVFELGGKTIGLVGFGGVGRHLARMAQGFNMNVVAVRRSPGNTTIDAVNVWGSDRFLDMLAIADVVVVSVPDLPDTRAMFDAEAFRQMMNHALLVTVGRGKTVHTEALVAALKAGEIGGAGLDVVDPEPLPDDHPLWQMRNVIITSHNAGTSPERGGRNRALMLENLKRFVRGEALLNVVDRETGY